MTTPLELLSPAGNADIGMAAIDHGADAVYIGAPAFSARASAGNQIEDIARLIEYAHRFAVRVYVALNTILSDAEIPRALDLIRMIHESDADGLIIQDMGLLELDLPPLPLIASTQTHNTTPEKVRFLEAAGFHRVILARELSLPEIRTIRDQTGIELEFFVYGALCVSYSGQCYLSQATAGRSGNRGVCAQPCRHRYTLSDGNGRIIVKDKHLLSLKDLNLIDAIPDLVEAGITSFKIEGRYKDIGYVKNVTAAFRRRIDAFIAVSPLYHRSSSGKATLTFTPDLEKTFNRGTTRYFIHGRDEKIGAIDTPKSVGKPVGTVTAVEKNCFVIKGDPVKNGDGLCFFSPSGELRGFRVNRADGKRIYPFGRMPELAAGFRLYRNHDHHFETILGKDSAVRKVDVSFRFFQQESRIRLTAIDEDGNRAETELDFPFQIAREPDIFQKQLHEQLSSSGNTIYNITGIAIDSAPPGFLPVSVINRLRRETLGRLTDLRLNRYRPGPVPFMPNTTPYPENVLDFRANVLNRLAARFYARHGTTVSEPALEGGTDPADKILMTSKYCLLHQLDACRRFARPAFSWSEPLRLTDGRRHYRLDFDCRRCVMHVYLESADSLK